MPLIVYNYCYSWSIEITIYCINFSREQNIFPLLHEMNSNKVLSCNRTILYVLHCKSQFLSIVQLADFLDLVPPAFFLNITMAEISYYTKYLQAFDRVIRFRLLITNSLLKAKKNDETYCYQNKSSAHVTSEARM